MNKMMAYHMDLKRGLWTRAYMDRMVDRLGEWGYNTLILELEDKFQFNHHPAIYKPDALSHSQMADFIAACRAKGVEVIPLVQTLGHAESVVGEPEYAHLREHEQVVDQYDPLAEASRTLILELIDEVIEVMQPQEFFHMGGDETWTLGKSEKARLVVEKIGIGGLYLKHMLPIFEHIHQQGLRPIIWADICLTHPEIIQDIPPYVVMVDWDYWTKTDRPEGILVWGGMTQNRNQGNVTLDQYQANKHRIPDFETYLEAYAIDAQSLVDKTFTPFYCTDALKGRGVVDVIVASAESCSGDMTGMPQNQQVHVPNCFFAARKGMQAGSGVMVTSWAVRHCHCETKLLAAFAAGFALKNDDAYNFEILCRAFTQDYYGMELPEFAEAVTKMGVSIVIAQAGYGDLIFATPTVEHDPLADYLLRIDQEYGSREAGLTGVEAMAHGYREAMNAFRKMQKQAKKNQDNFDYLVEGTRRIMLYIDFVIVALKNELPAQTARLLEKLCELKCMSRELYGRNYTPEGIAVEMKVRYQAIEEFLRR